MFLCVSVHIYYVCILILRFSVNSINIVFRSFAVKNLIIYLAAKSLFIWSAFFCIVL